MADTSTSAPTGFVDWGDTSFEPEARQYDRDDIRWFRMSKEWPQKPFEGRRFQLGGIERVAFLEEAAYVHYAHRFNAKYMGSAVNGTRRCTMDVSGHCVACQHYDQAPQVLEGGKPKKQARCGPRQQQFGANLIVYRTDLQGNLIDQEGRRLVIDQNQGIVYENGAPAFSAIQYEIFLWRFSADKFTAIRTIKREWGGIREHDLVMVLDVKKDEKFQDFTTQVGSASVWRLLAKAGAEGTARAKELVEYYKDNKYDVEAILGKVYTDEEMMGFIGSGQAAAPPQGGPATEDVAAEIERALGGEMAPAPPPPPVAPQAADGAVATPPAAAPSAVPPPAPPAAPVAPPLPQASDGVVAPPAPPAAQPPAPTPPPPPAEPVTSDFDALLSMS